MIATVETCGIDSVKNVLNKTCIHISKNAKYPPNPAKRHVAKAACHAADNWSLIKVRAKEIMNKLSRSLSGLSNRGEPSGRTSAYFLYFEAHSLSMQREIEEI